MSKPPRDRTSFGSNVYFVTAGTSGHRSLFQTDRMARLFIDTMFHYRREGRFLLHEFVLMPTHFHLLLTPSGVKLERVMQFIKGGFSYRAKKELALNMEIWERGYIDHRIRDANDTSDTSNTFGKIQWRQRLWFGRKTMPIHRRGQDSNWIFARRSWRESGSCYVDEPSARG
jgi:REP element-mobilizing transposase RayT